MSTDPAGFELPLRLLLAFRVLIDDRKSSSERIVQALGRMNQPTRR